MPVKNSREVVLAFVDALNRADFQAARECVTDDLNFVGALGSREGADAYFRDMERMRLKYDVKKAFAEDDDVCLFYDVTMSGITAFCAGWYRLSQGKIRSFRVVFDPRPVLEAAQKNK
ncbi:MAG: nuclear transport factor 2 family protein [Terriglobales bacterium]